MEIVFWLVQNPRYKDENKDSTEKKLYTPTHEFQLTSHVFSKTNEIKYVYYVHLQQCEILRSE